MDEEERRRQAEVEKEWLRRSGEWDTIRRTPKWERWLLGLTVVVLVVGFFTALIYWLSTNTLTSW